MKSSISLNPKTPGQQSGKVHKPLLVFQLLVKSTHPPEVTRLVSDDIQNKNISNGQPRDFGPKEKLDMQKIVVMFGQENPW